MDFDPAKDYYKVLDIPEASSQDEVKKKFRKLAMKYHPDKANGDKAKFQEVNEAYGVLSDKKKRSQYDMYRKNGGGMGGFGGFGGFSGGQGGFDIDLGDVMGQFFGGGRNSQRGGPQAGEDVQVGLEISFDEAFLGISKKIKFARKTLVQDADKKQCSTCKGMGRVMQQTQTMFGVMQTQNICTGCQGVGSLFTKDGKSIPGGLETSYEEVEVNVPAGIKDNVYIRYTGKGDIGLAGGTAGDLYVHIRVKRSSLYTREGNSLLVTVEIPFFDLVLGNKISVPHPEGKITVKIPKGTQITDRVKISKKGFGDKGIFARTGDMYIIPKVRVPKKLSKEEEVHRKALQNKS